MKIYKRLACTLALGMTFIGSLSNLYANDTKKSEMDKVVLNFAGFSGLRYAPTTSGDYYNDHLGPTIGTASIRVIDSETCLVVHIEDSGSGVGYVTIDGTTASRKSGDAYSGDYYIELTTSGTHTIYAQDVAGNRNQSTPSVTVNDTTKPTLDLSQTFKNGYCYLVIEASDNTALESVTVDGSVIDFNASGGTENYKVTKSKNYTVVAKDIAGYTTRETYEVVVDASQPSLNVDKTYKNNSWYLTIKAYPTGNATISKVTVNNSKVACNSAGQVIEYAVASTGTYTVVVTDSFNQQATQSITVDTGLNGSSTQPTLTVTQKDMGGVMGLSITAKPSGLYNSSISKVTVNGQSVAMPVAGGTIDYSILTSGSYTVVVVDTNGNQATQTCYVTVPASTVSTPTVTVPQTQGYSNAAGSSNVVFTLNKKTWTKNGVSQQNMDAAPISRNGRIYIPIRYVAYALNINSSKVTWNKSAKSAIIYDGTNTVTVPLGSKTMNVNGVAHAMGAAAISASNRVYIPISQIKSAFPGVDMVWNNTSKQITIKR